MRKQFLMVISLLLVSRISVSALPMAGENFSVPTGEVVESPQITSVTKRYKTGEYRLLMAPGFQGPDRIQSDFQIMVSRSGLAEQGRAQPFYLETGVFSKPQRSHGLAVFDLWTEGNVSFKPPIIDSETVSGAVADTGIEPKP